MKYISYKPALQALIILLSVLLLANTGTATTAIMLSDEELITSARVIILGDVVSTKAQWDLNHYNINTYVKVKVSKVIKGQLQNEHIVFKQLGGTVGEDSTVIFGAPRYEAGQRVLLFLDTTREGTLRIAQLFQGKYDVTVGPTGAFRVERKVDKGAVNLLGASEGSSITNSSTLARFTKKIKRVLRAHAAEISALDQNDAVVPIVETPPEYIDSDSADITPQYEFLGSYRWFEPDTNQPVSYRINPASAPVAGGGSTEINQAFAAWTNVTTTALVLQNVGATTQFGFRQDGVSAISFNDPLDQMSDPVGCSGTLAIGGVTSAGGGTRVIGGITFSHIFEGDVVFNRNFACFLGISANLAEVATHEIGHSIGFGHSADTAATMYATAHGGGRGATLGSDDIAAVTFLYPGSKGAPPPPPPPPAPVPPVAPSGLLASPASASAINLTWVDGSNNEDGFRLQRRIGTTGTYAVIATLPAGQVAYTDTGLAASTNYYYRILAFNGAGDSGFSNEAQATTSTAATADNAAFVSQTVPASMTPGQSYSVTVTMRNTGTTIWSPSSGYRLGSQNPQDNFTWGLNRVSLISSVAPGGSALIKFIVRAPSTSGLYNFQWQMFKDGAGFFGGLTQTVAVQVGSGGGGGTNGASFVTQSAPASLSANQSATVSVTMRNSGTTAWDAGTYFLGSQNPQDNSTWGLNRVSLNSSVSPGSDATFTFNVTAPSTAGTFNFQWRMLQSGAGYFGSASTNVAITVIGTGGGGGANNATFISQSVPASMNAGQSYAVSVTMRNSGTTTWTAGTYFLGSQNPQDNLTWGVNQLSLPASVAQGSDATFTFNVTAPSAAGTYSFQWRMLQSGVGYFGAATTSLGVSVVSSGPPTAPVTITTTAVANGARGQFYSQQLNATGGTAPYSWAVAAGALPAGLSLDRNTGLISGTPATIGTFNFTVAVTDQNGSSASKLYKTLVR